MRLRFTIRHLLWLTALVALGTAWWVVHSRNSVPRLFQEKAFTAASLAEAVNHFVDLGEEQAVRKLSALALDTPTDVRGDWSSNERIGWMCRVLYESKGANPLRQPYFGGLDLPYHTMLDTSWPLYPVALSGSTYFVLSEGYSLAGVAEDPREYIEYCRQSGVFRKKRIAVPTRTQALKDATTLGQSVAWKAIKWTDSGTNWSYTLSEQETWTFIQNQAEMIR